MSYFAYITAAGFGLFSMFSTLYTPFLFLLRAIGIHYYIIRNDDEKTRAIIKVLKTATTNSISLFQCGAFHPSGCFINRRCMGFYDYSSNYGNTSIAIHIFTTTQYFQTIFETEKAPISFSDNSALKSKTIPSSSSSITIYSRTGSYSNIFYSRLRIDVNGLEPKGQQGEIVDHICENFAKERRGVYFIHGVSGAGKSTIGLLVANRLKGSFSHTFNPTEPGDTLHHLLRDSDPTDEHPTIILLEEVNTMIHAIHDGTIPKHKNVTTCIYNKSTYNTFVDDLILYRNVMIIMTSNESKESIDNLDPCYLRKGRVSSYYSMLETLTPHEHLE